MNCRVVLARLIQRESEVVQSPGTLHFLPKQALTLPGDRSVSKPCLMIVISCEYKRSEKLLAGRNLRDHGSPNLLLYRAGVQASEGQVVCLNSRILEPRLEPTLRPLLCKQPRATQEAQCHSLHEGKQGSSFPPLIPISSCSVPFPWNKGCTTM